MSTTSRNVVASRACAVITLLALMGACGDDGPREAGEPADVARIGNAASTTSTTVPVESRLGVIVDYSPTVSDVTALLALTQDPDVELLAVTIAGTGESHCDAAVDNTVGLLDLVGLDAVQVACGPTDPVGPGVAWPDSWRDAADALDGLQLPTQPAGRSTGDTRDAVELLAETARARSTPVTIVALGPLTNVALAIERHPSLAGDVADIYTMGGAFDVAGNAPNGAAEWNYAIDPAAVDVVLRSGMPITIVPLDATDQVPVSRAWFDALTRHHTTGAAAAVHGLMAAARPFEHDFFFWDELATLIALDGSLATTEERRVVVETDGPDAGRTRSDATGAVVRSATDVDVDRFGDALLTILNGGAPAPAVEPATPDVVAYFEAVQAASHNLDERFGALFDDPAAESLEELVGDGSSNGSLTAAQEDEVRAFMVRFWKGAIDLIETYRADLDALDVPMSVTDDHAAYLDALDALVGTEPARLAELADLHGDDLVGFLWSPTPEIAQMESECAGLEAAASAHGLDVRVCPT
jgi:inosine-uridine nucleoside N-ribohydrolase